MAVESATYIHQLDETLPAGGDSRAEGDDHVRLTKGAVKATFANVAGAVTATHTELNRLVGVTSGVQTQLDARGLIAGQTWTGTHTFSGTIVVPTQSAGDATTKAASTAFVSTAVAAAVAVPFSSTTTAVSKTLANYEHCVVTASGQTISLPGSPTAGNSVVRITTRVGISTTIGRNGSPIMGRAEDMTQPFGDMTVTLAYLNATDGWVIQ